MKKDEFLDKKNIDLIREVKHAIDYKVNAALISKELRMFGDNNPGLTCKIKRCDTLGIRPTYQYEQMFLDILKMMSSGELVFKEDLIKSIVVDDNYKNRMIIRRKNYKKTPKEIKAKKNDKELIDLLENFIKGLKSNSIYVSLYNINKPKLIDNEFPQLSEISIQFKDKL